MGVRLICACHECKEFIDLNKVHLSYLNGEAISFEPEYFDTVDMHYELYHNYRLLRFIFLHQQNDCRIDLIQTTDEDHYFYVTKNYKEVDFTTDMNGTPWARIWKRSQENISVLDDECAKAGDVLNV